MKIFRILLLLPVLITAQSNKTTENVYYDKLPHIKIDKIVFYESPYTILYNKPMEINFKPNWYWGYCSSSYPLAFDNFTKEALKYRASDNQSSEQVLEDYEKKFKTLKNEQFRTPYVYYFGEIYFTYRKSKKQYIKTLYYSFNKEFKNLDFNKIDTLKFKKKKTLEKGKKITDLEPNEMITYLPTTSDYYVLEDGIYKWGNLSNIHDNILRQGDHSLFFNGNLFNQFCVMLRRAPSYIRSRVENGKRYFETVKQTPKGIVVIGKKRKQLDDISSQ
ncbi:hypothetical protein [Flavobacterium aquiphilum]|uniref:hypothetical protein n=1 Tax=Flavobacterium aquiphilum TaxID=3003261 RepID=UPI00247FB841|nr:hypothetical protein [Flavobacterium aquiphilum]